MKSLNFEAKKSPPFQGGNLGVVKQFYVLISVLVSYTQVVITPAIKHIGTSPTPSVSGGRGRQFFKILYLTHVPIRCMIPLKTDVKPEFEIEQVGF